MTNDINLLGTQIESLEAEIVRIESLRDESYEDAEAADVRGDGEASARHDAWLGVFEPMLKSLRASLYAACQHYNSLLIQAEVA